MTQIPNKINYSENPIGRCVVPHQRDVRRRGEVLGQVSTREGTPRLVTGCDKLYRARSRLYRNEILQVDMRLKALAEIYTMRSFALL